MPRKVEFLAREMAHNAGYDPDQLVVAINPDRDFDYLAIGFAPVSIKDIHPLFTFFYSDARRALVEQGELCDG